MKRKQGLALAVLLIGLLVSGCWLFINIYETLAGQWNIHVAWTHLSPSDSVITFNENKTLSWGPFTGTWSVKGREITFTLTSSSVLPVYVGTINKANTYMSGTMSNNIAKNGTWYANIASAALLSLADSPEQMEGIEGR